MLPWRGLGVVGVGLGLGENIVLDFEVAQGQDLHQSPGACQTKDLRDSLLATTPRKHTLQEI